MCVCGVGNVWGMYVYGVGHVCMRGEACMCVGWGMYVCRVGQVCVWGGACICVCVCNQRFVRLNSKAKN